MHIIKTSFILFFISLLFSARGQTSVIQDSLPKPTSADSLRIIPKNPLHAAGFIISTNLAVWSFDRFILKAPFARINFNTIQRNFKSGFVWDNDMFETNLFFHPYHGGLYFNAARSNGLNLWQSVPMAAGGSLMWEFCMENDPPGINDFMATTIGGTCLGEMTFRISDLLIDNRAMGSDRFLREMLLTIISPILGLNRLISGEAWKHRSIRGNTLLLAPVVFYSTIGYRIMADDIPEIQDARKNVSLDLGLYYGNPFDPDNEKPYDFFSLKAGGNIFSQQRFISHVNALGLLFSKNITLRKPHSQLLLGIFQHFNYYQATSDINNTSLNPYKISEAASVGTGLLFKTNLTRHFSFLSSAHLSAILLGGSQTDYYKHDLRDYNMGSGFSSKLNFVLEWGSKARIMLNSEDYRIYSWIGYDSNKAGEISTNVQGDICNASLSVVSLNFNYIINRHFLLTAETGYYYRRSIYKYYSNVSHRTTENKLSVGYIF